MDDENKEVEATPEVVETEEEVEATDPVEEAATE